MLDWWHNTWIYSPALLVQDVLSLMSGAPDWVRTLVASVVGLIGLMIVIVPSQLATIWIERKALALIQQRYGPNRVGPRGLLQPIADALKIMTKEAITPALGDRLVFWAAPIVFFVPAFLVWAVVPFGPGMIYADLNIGALYLVAVGSISVIPVFMAGWSSNNKFALLGAMRAVAQSISYEVPMVLSLVGVILLAGSLQISAIVSDQIYNRGIWYVFMQPLGFLIFFITASAELNRTPTDIMEAESELVAGYHTEYSGMKFSLFYVAEYTSLLVLSGLLAALFFGAWGFPVLDQVIPPWLIFIGKLYAFFLVFVWLRGTLPRLRIDQLMHFAWKYLLPLALVNLMLVGAEVVLLEGALTSIRLASWLLAALNLALALILLVGWARFFNLPGISRSPTWSKAPLEPLQRAGEALRP
jgi:NADH-quinone oxidoreductase subunit H